MQTLGRVLAILCIWAIQAAAQNAGQDEDLIFGNMALVESAGMHAQTLRDAPANVTIISDEDIRIYGYRTLGEALSYARGFYLTDDRAYEHLGLRGFNLPGDYGTRWLVMINGHPMADHIFEATGYFAQDFGIDLAVVKRIEIIRGPCSALYGSTAIFGIINVVTRSADEGRQARAAVETDSTGERKLEFETSSARFLNSEVLFSGSVFNNAGSALPVTSYGAVIPAVADSQRGYHSLFEFHHNDWQIEAMFADRQKGMPVPWDDAVAGDAGNRIWDDRRFIDASWSHHFDSGTLIWRNSWDWYSYRGWEDLASNSGIYRAADLANTSWLTSRGIYQFNPSRFGTFAAGAEVSADLTAWQHNYDMLQPRAWNVDISHRKVQGALLLQDEVRLSERWKAVLGARYDRSSAYGGSLSGRGALLFQQSDGTVWKLIGGRSYRDPSDYEQLYHGADGVDLAAAPLKHETVLTAELNIERRLNRHWSVIGGAYRYQLRNPIELFTAGATDPASGTVLTGNQYENGIGVRSTGVEGEIDGQFGRSLNLAASIAVERTADEGRIYFPNSPNAVAAFRCAHTLWRDRLTLSTGVHYVSAVRTLANASLHPVWIPEATLGLRNLANGLDMQVGVRNLSNSGYTQPIALDPRVDTIEGQGRSIFIRLQWETRE